MNGAPGSLAPGVCVGVTAINHGRDQQFADTVDCQCLIVHSSLIQRHKLRFDENLTFDFYVEEFCINASERYDVKLKVIPLKCVHYSGGNITERFYNSVKYVQEKYKTISKCYASTVAHTVIGRDKSTKKIKTARHFDWRTFLFQKKITNSGKLLIKICKIPIFSKKVGNKFLGEMEENENLD